MNETGALDPWLDLRQGDALTVLKTLPDQRVNAVVTSPPYWGLRDYGMEGQLGLEPTPEVYVETMTAIFREVRRVLRDDGTLWLNIGDSYCNSDKWGGGGANTGKHTKAPDGTVPSWIAVRRRGAKLPGIKPKDLVGIPWMLAFALRADGWYLRSDIIWAKPNPMPESITDRPTKAHEYLFLLAKSERYFYDADAIREPYSAETKALSFETMEFARRDGYKAGRKIKMPDGWDTGAGGHGSFNRNGREKGKQREIAANAVGSSTRRLDGLNDRWDEAEAAGALKDGANKRTVWTIATEAYPEAHFATFPTALVRPCVLAGCPEGGLVLDPFLGSGTTAMVANQLGRRAIGIELNPLYLEAGAKALRSGHGVGMEPIIEAIDNDQYP